MRSHIQDDGEGGLGLRGVAFMTVLALLRVLAVLESTLPSVCLAYKIQCQETTVTVLTVFGGFGGCGGFGRDGHPP